MSVTEGEGIIPSYITELTSNPVIRIRNIHPELTEDDLSGLLSQISPVEFVKFDADKKSVAYCGFQENWSENNAESIKKFDGRKAMGKILIVEDPLKPKTVKSLQDRLGPLPGARERGFRGPKRRDNRGPRGPRDSRDFRDPGDIRQKQRGRREPPKPKKVPKSVEDLDRELSEYMNST
ncbi:hypothetical protein PSN45_001908 [Yamadazyma tenuis]|uniref:RRM domain-containing protein n=1 Tax=Candida tenuis (strain ATCC 10573 / BCRC 21748 / CBS 615 / JCM 9827 / NBRC 10315 / NRRL Y-1498 / VKM Y-70) TaxID=590646 RepID=G3BDM4_CANTC|nr:uncharacterized protein CANTEDRAFT_116388 [Yamadazyma tenuis ATCC 10573]EGV60339.1 hypothetical protein CANTEDRAFT_116388 [Yamadazyma tenuis ATCC 10573]WEJ94424.1 hypothetical protein PSN45_001908 [Yamadazyma tenuis]